MPDPSPIADAQPAGSSPAAVSSPVAADTDPLDRLSETDLQAWRLDGKLPSERPVATPPADSSPATAVHDQPASTDALPSAASEPAPPSATPGADKRIPELLADRARERDRADRAERHIRELEARPHQPLPDARPAASSPAPAGLSKPDPESFAYGTADPGYLEALTDYKVAATLAEQRATWEHGQQQQAAQVEQHRVIEAFRTRVEAATAKHPDFEAVALKAPSLIPPGSLMDAVVLESPAGAELLYHLQTHPAELQRLLALPLLDQIADLTRLADRLSADAPAGSPTHAPPPPPTLSTRATPADPVDRALAEGTGDEATGAYMAAQNRRDLARLKR